LAAADRHALPGEPILAGHGRLTVGQVRCACEGEAADRVTVTGALAGDEFSCMAA
jgi:hypothetical protein